MGLVRAVCALLVCASFTLDYLVLDLGIGSAALRVIPELMIVALLALAAVNRRGRLDLWLPSFAVYTGAAVLLGALHFNFGWSGEQWLRAVFGLRNLVRFVAFAVALANLPLNDRHQRSLLSIVVALLVMQVPVAIYQWGVQGLTGDRVFGTVRSTGTMAILMLFGVIVILCRGVFLKSWLLLPVLPLLALPPLLGEGKAFFILLPIVLAVFYADTVTKRPVRATILAAAGIAVFWYGLNAFETVPGQPNLRQFLADKLDDPFGDTGQNIEISQVARLQELRAAFEEGSANFGLGSGLGARTVFGDEVVVDRQTRVLAMTTAAFVVAELGLWGFGLFLTMIVHVGWTARRLAHRGPTPLSRFTGAVACYSSVLVAGALFYTNLSLPPVACAYWTFVGCAFSQMLRARHPTRRGRVQSVVGQGTPA